MTARRQRAIGWLTFALALALRLAFVATLDERLTWSDEGEYVAIGRRLAAGEGFVASSYRSAPVLPAYLGLVFGVFGDGFAVPRIGQALLGALSCVLVGRAAGLLVSPAVGALSGALLAVYPAHIYLTSVFYTSCLETFLCVWCVLLAARVLRGRGGAGTAALCGVALGMAVLTRPVLVVVGPAVAAAWWLTGAGSRRRALAATAALALGVAVTVLPWTARNRVVFGRAMVSSGGGLTFWKGNNELADGSADDRFLGWDRPVWRARLAELGADEQRALTARYVEVQDAVRARERQVGDHYLALDDVLGPLGRAYVAAEPGAALRRTLRKLGTFFSAFSHTATQVLTDRSALLAAVTFYPLLGLALLGALLGGARRGLLLPYLVVIAMAAVHAVLTSCTRFRLPVDPYIIMGAAFTAVELRARRGARGRVPASAAGSVSGTKV